MAHDHFTTSDLDPSCAQCQLTLAMRPLEAGEQPAPRREAQPYDEVRVGSLDHLTYDHPAAAGARTFCGIYLAGTPVAPGQDNPCGACEALRPCDECSHTGPEHLWAPALEAKGQAEAARYVYDHATCWGENVCRGCDPELHNDVLVRTLGHDAPAGAGEAVEAYRG